jgi:hypothetical protein
MESLIQYLKITNGFVNVKKKPIELERAIYQADSPFRKNTFCVFDGAKSKALVTRVNGKVETRNMMHCNDVIITGPLNETYVMSVSKFLNLYNVIDDVAVPKPIIKRAAVVTKEIFKKLKLGSKLTFTAPWGSPMILEPGDALVLDTSAASSGVYRIEKSIFMKTYDIMS